MAVLDDTNTAHRGGREGVQFVKASARAFIDAGGVAQTDWLPQARAIHADCVARRLSPGGSADVLAAACWLQELQELAAVQQQAAVAGMQASHKQGRANTAGAPAMALRKQPRGAAQAAPAQAAPFALLASAWAA
jgi:hypothetical protein